MKNLLEIIKKRSTPGVFIFDLEEKLLYANPEAMNTMPDLGEPQEGSAFENVPKAILNLLRKLKGNSTKVSNYESIEQNCVVVEGAGDPCALRAFYIGHDVGNKNPTHIMVMVERIAKTHDPDFSKAKLDFDLSNREIEVLRFICRGFANKAISEELFISEYTVKDHIKKIMRKMKVSSRSEIVASLK